MKALTFRLRGETAFFKKPDVNTYLYFTYGNIHKIAVLGIIGAALGLEGYSQQKEKEEVYPKFYKELCDLKMAIVPKNEKGYIPKKLQIFNNSVGYASQEEGGNLIVKEQWLEKPMWDIYISLDESSYAEKIRDRFLNYNFVYVPYLGKNDHFANIEEVKEVELNEIEGENRIDSLFLKNYFEFSKDDGFSVLFDDFAEESKWKYEEKLPISLEEVANQYVTENFVFTNMKVKLKEKYPLYSHIGKTLFFF